MLALKYKIYLMIMRLNDYLFYPALIEKVDDTYVVSIKNDATSARCFDTFYIYGNTEDELLSKGTETILKEAERLMNEWQYVPFGDAYLKDVTHVFVLQYHQALNIMLYNAILDKYYDLQDICNELRISREQFKKILDLWHDSSIDDIYGIFRVIGRSLETSC